MNGQPNELTLTSSYSGLKLAALTWGSPEGKLKVMGLHGWMDNAATWSHLVSLLVAKLPELYFVSLEMAGHGHSEHRQDHTTYNHVDYVPDILAAADALGWHQFSIFGHSMGAALATTTACVAPSRVQSLVLVEGFGPWVSPESAFLKNLRSAIETNRVVFSKRPHVYPDMNAAVTRWMEGSKTPGLTIEAVRTIVARGTMKTKEGLVFRHDLKLKCSSLQRMTETEVGYCLDELKANVLLVWGKTGFYPTQPMFKETIEARKERVRKHGVEVNDAMISGGHHCHLDHPEEMMEHVVSFFGQQP